MTTPLPQNPFPGMNPYLENPGLWPEVHNKVIVGLSDLLSPQLQPDYVVRTAQRVYIDAEPGTGGIARQRIPDAMILADGTVGRRSEIAAAEPPTGGFRRRRDPAGYGTGPTALSASPARGQFGGGRRH